MHGTTAGGQNGIAFVFVVDAEVAHGIADVDALREEMLATLRLVLSADWDQDGDTDSTPFQSIRLAVLDASGREHTSLPYPPPIVPWGAVPVLDGAIEVWPGDGAWDGWFIDTARARLTDALAAPPVTDPALTRATTAFLARHPDFVSNDGTNDLAIVLLTDRDETTPTLPRLGVWIRGSISIVAALREGDLGSIAAENYAAVLGTSSFDEARVPCADGTIVGMFPRALLGTMRTAAASGWATGGSSLCAPSGVRDALLATLHDRYRDGQLSLCLPRALDVEASGGTAPCRMNVLLPAVGLRRRCVDFGLESVAVEPSVDGERERCEVPQLPRANIGDGRVGFYYDDFTPDLYERCSMAAPQALSTSAYTHWPPGTEGEATCFSGSAACGFELPDAGSSDAGSR